MASPREIRRLAFQALYQLDARGEADAEDIRASLESTEAYPVERDRGMALALAAFRDRHAADEAMLRLAPGWPAHRQAAVDRAILRLAHYEMTSGTAPPKVAVNEAVELAKAYSTDKSPAFINALLDKVLRSLPDRGASHADPADPADQPIDPGPIPNPPDDFPLPADPARLREDPAPPAPPAPDDES